MDSMLLIEQKVVFDDSLSQYEVHAHQPYGSPTSFNSNDEIRISIQNQDLYVLPSHSSLHVFGRLTNADGTAAPRTVSLVNNAIMHLFEEIRYELNSVEIERVKHTGLATTMKAYVSQNPGQQALMENAGWLCNTSDAQRSLTNASGYFDISIPLRFIMGFAEDYHRIVVNAKHELILTRANTDTNAIMRTIDNQPAAVNGPAGADNEQWLLNLLKVEWLMPYVKVSDQHKIHLLNFIATDPAIAISFRSWELYEYPLLPPTNKHIWNVKTSTQLEKPRYVIVGFQTNRKNNVVKNASEFDHCNIRDVKLFLNSQCYPYNGLNLNIDRNQFALLYAMYARFQSSYYGVEDNPLLTKGEFLQKAPLIVIDCSKQNESLISGSVDIRLELESEINFPPQTAAYCLILHDRLFEYQPVAGIIKKLV